MHRIIVLVSALAFAIGTAHASDCTRWACQVQACVPKIRQVNHTFIAVTVAESLAFCLYRDSIGNDGGAIVSGLGEPLQKTNVKCDSGVVKQFQFDIWRSPNPNLGSGQYTLPWDNTTSIDTHVAKACGISCTAEQQVNCIRGNAIDLSTRNCPTKGCAYNENSHVC